MAGGEHRAGARGGRCALDERMSVWSKIFGVGRAASEPDAAESYVAPSPAQPTSVVLRKNRLALEFHAHLARAGVPGNFLSVFSRGFERYKQREYVITLLVSPSEDVTQRMRGLSRFFATAFRWAQEGMLVGPGDFTQFGERGLFGARHNGLLYTEARPLADVPLPADALAAVVVNDDELRVAMSFGVYRVLARIAQHYGQFPAPTWSDLKRASVATPAEAESQLAKVKRIRARGVSVLVDQDRVRISLPTEVKAVLAHGLAGLPHGAPFALLTDMAADANAALVWHPGQQDSKILIESGTDGARVSGAFLMIVPGGRGDQARAMEDGYALLFSSATWHEALPALLAQRSLSLRMADGITVLLEWQESGARKWLG